jgi:hypothetical protein
MSETITNEFDETYEALSWLADDIAVAAGFTQPARVPFGPFEMWLLVKPGTDITGKFDAWCHTEQKFMKVSGRDFDIREYVGN